MSRIDLHKAWIAQTPFIIGAAIGSGGSALAAERGGADFLIALNAGKLRSKGAPSIAAMLPLFEANALTDTFAREELLPQCRRPVLLGVSVWQTNLDVHAFAKEIRDAGYDGVTNFPTSIHYPRSLQQLLSNHGAGIEKEVEMLKAAQDLGLTAMFYCATRTQARLAADVGLDLICLNMGWNVGGSIGHSSLSTIEEMAIAARDVQRLVKRISPKTRFLLEGGPLETSEDLAKIVALTPADGYVGGSTIDRMPLEASVADRIYRFRRAGRRRIALDKDTENLVNWGYRHGFYGRSRPQLDFLTRLVALSTAKEPVHVVMEPGSLSFPVLKALAQRAHGKVDKSIIQIDVLGEDYPERARRLLFGEGEGAGKRQPVLADPSVSLVAIHGPEKLPIWMQRRVCKVLQDGSFKPTNTRKEVLVKPRIVLVSDVDLSGANIEHLLTANGLHKDLVMWLAGWRLRLPPLRERTGDLLEILDHMGSGSDGDHAPFTGEALQTLQDHHWPHNEAEFRRVVGAFSGRQIHDPISSRQIKEMLKTDMVEVGVGRSEKDRIVNALWQNGFNRTKTADALGISRKTLYNKIVKYQLN